MEFVCFLAEDSLLVFRRSAGELHVSRYSLAQAQAMMIKNLRRHLDADVFSSRKNALAERYA
jgi:hypothetical protein